MVVVMEERASEEQVQHVIAQLVEKGFDVHRSTGQLRSVLGAVGGNRSFDTRLIEVMDGVGEVLRITEPYKLASRTFKPERTSVSFDEFRVGGDEVIVMAGPCSVETEEQIAASAATVKKAGAKVLRGGAFKPRSSPYSFQGLGEEGLRMMRAAADAEGLKIVSEVMDVSQIDLVARYADILQVGARNMQNYTLLRELGRSHTRFSSSGGSPRPSRSGSCRRSTCSRGATWTSSCVNGVSGPSRATPGTPSTSRRFRSSRN